MKIKSLLIGMLACTALVGCTSEDVIDNPSGNQSLSGEKGYLKVKLVNTTGTAGRAADGFAEGTADENNVSSVNFFFFKSDGTLTHHADENDLSWHTSTGNVEKIADATVVLQGLNDKTYPNSVIVLLNAPSSLITELSKSTTTENVKTFDCNLQSFSAKVIEAIQDGNDFIMTNSTFKPETNEDGTAVNTKSTVETTTYAGTVVTQDDFVLESDDAELSDANTVNIYVERLAAKVTVDVTTGEKITKTNGVAKAEIGSFTIREINDAGEEVKTPKTLYAQIEGWGMNATNKETNLIKKINPDWNFPDVVEDADIDQFFDWNDAGNYRSYWGKSINYEDENAVYPASFADAIDAEGSGVVTGNDQTDANDAKLNYYSFDEMTKSLGGFDYCMENTNSQNCNVFVENFYSAVTQVVIAAKIVDEAGQAVELVRYNRILYTPDAFFARVLNEVDLDIWKETTAEGATDRTFAQLSAADVEEYNVYDGKVKVRAKNADETWYTRREATDADANVSVGGFVYEAYTGVTLAARLAAIFEDDVVAEYYNDGMMHYVVPIKHLRASDGIFEDINGPTDQVSIAEAEFGVVRNHLYNLNVTQIDNLGTSVYDASEDIIKTTTDETTYLIAAQLNILSWRIVGQEVKL